MQSNSVIWENFKKGDESALEFIYFQNIKLLYRYGRKFTSDKELIKDTIQDLFVDLLTARNNLGETDSIRFYLLKAFKHRLFRNLKKISMINDELDESEYQIEIIYSVEDIIISKEEIAEKEKLLLNGLKSISPKQREILFYKFTCSLEYDQICDLMSINYESARKQVYRAIKTLKEIIYSQSHPGKLIKSKSLKESI
jgi:RNA polymerase sigma factor (sigma-70 family)